MWSVRKKYNIPIFFFFRSSGFKVGGLDLFQIIDFGRTLYNLTK
jgi:hypothetical protein